MQTRSHDFKQDFLSLAGDKPPVGVTGSSRGTELRVRLRCTCSQAVLGILAIPASTASLFAFGNDDIVERLGGIGRDRIGSHPDQRGRTVGIEHEASPRLMRIRLKRERKTGVHPCPLRR